jgi:hypothetical protein
MCRKNDKFISIARYSIGILSLMQAFLLSLVIYLSLGMSSQTLYNLEDLELSSYKSTSMYTGLIFISIATFCCLLGLTLASCKRICCQKPLLFLFGLTLTFVFFSFLIFGSGLLMISSSSQSYLEEFCRQRVTVKY